MSATITHAAHALLGARDNRSVAPGIDVVAVLLLLVLLAEVEIVGAYLGSRRTGRLLPLAVAIVPLCLVFVLIVLVRSKGIR
jgi:CHASE2 domain-containing sensor protein